MQAPSPDSRSVYRIALIGAGQLGSRHLQGLAGLELPCEIDVVDPSTDALNLARQRFAEIPVNASIRAVRYHTALTALPASLDYVVVATAADVRLAVMQQLLPGRSVQAMLLEKVLFQRLGDYARAQALLADGGTRAWVNCTRRLYPIYQELGALFAQDPLRDFRVGGGNWGLGCNSIHFVDLLGMITGHDPDGFDTGGLDRDLVASKRKGFMEFTGSLRGRAGAVQFEMTSWAGSGARLLLTMRSDTLTCIVDETATQAFILDGKPGSAWESRTFRAPFLSQVAASIATDILTRGSCGLTSFDQSARYHLPLMTALASHACLVSGTTPDFCPVT